jgi:hypothetical protein
MSNLSFHHPIIPLFLFVSTIFNFLPKVQSLLELSEESAATRIRPPVIPPYLPLD